MVPSSRDRNIRVAIFCGGRGSAMIVRELARHPDVDLTLLVNAYDDGLSTGALRELIPGFLGPSDFRKNLSYLVDPYSREQYALQQMLEFRIPDQYGSTSLSALERFAINDEIVSAFPPELAAHISVLRIETRERLRELISNFVKYFNDCAPVNLADFAFGNLLFAGAYLGARNDFNAAIATVADLFDSQAAILNVSDGEARTLVALKAGGTVLGREAEVVGAQSDDPITDFYFLASPLTPVQRQELEGLDIAGRHRWLQSHQLNVTVSPEAGAAVRRADIIIYGPGTQHSSLLPSYTIVHNAIEGSRALKVWIANLETDLDINGMQVLDLVDTALRHLHDDGSRHLIDAILANEATMSGDLEVDESRLDADRRYRDIPVVKRNFRNPVMPSRHSGHETVLAVMDLYQKFARDGDDALEIYVDLKQRDLALAGVLQEFCEIDWRRQVRHTRLIVNTEESLTVTVPSHLEVVTVSSQRRFSEVDAFFTWLTKPGPAYLATLTGDGEYRFRDVFTALEMLERGGFGAVFGSRSQSRRRFASSALAEHGEKSSLRRLSAVSSLLATLVLAVRAHVIFSDPFTGFRVYGRARMPEPSTIQRRSRDVASATALAGRLIENGVEVAEIPVSYRTYAGFTDSAWRIRRGISNLFGAVGW